MTRGRFRVTAVAAAATVVAVPSSAPAARAPRLDASRPPALAIGNGNLAGDLSGVSARAGAVSPVVAENALPGSSGWELPQAPGPVIEGYVSEASVLPGDTLHFHVSMAGGGFYRIELYRLGWYGGVGARRVACLPSCNEDKSTSEQPVPPPDPATGEVVAGWPVSSSFTVPADAVSGYYLVELVVTRGPDAGEAARSYVIVRSPPGRNSALLVQVPVNTWQAYNGWGGKSLYNFSSSGGLPAVKVSFERPYCWTTCKGTIGPLDWELPLVRFLEREGYDVSYQTDLDTDRDPGSLLRHRVVVTAGHAEYWTKNERDAFDAALAAGTNLAFMGANTGYWQVRSEDGGQTLVGYKTTAPDPNPDPAERTVMFRMLGRYECMLEGIQHQGGNLHWPIGNYTVTAAGASDPWLLGTGLSLGSTIQGIVSVERDTIPASDSAHLSCGNQITDLFHLEAGGDTNGNGDAVRYTASSGARVFASGSRPG